MGELSNQRQQQHVGDSSARPPDKRLSVMRRYLESGVDFEWPEGVGTCLGNHCDLNSGPGHHIPLIWKSRISDKKASIDVYVGGEQYAFKEAFAVKTIREKTYLKSKTRARNEVENMKDLRYCESSPVASRCKHCSAADLDYVSTVIPMSRRYWAPLLIWID